MCLQVKTSDLLLVYRYGIVHIIVRRVSLDFPNFIIGTVYVRGEIGKFQVGKHCFIYLES